MKKYQLWLQRKTYSQHLSNLMRIKASHSERRLPTRIVPLKQKASSPVPRAKTVDRRSELLSPRDISYIITAHQLKKHKLRLVQTNEIVRENREMVKRLNGAKPFVSNKRPIDHSNYKLKRRMQRANEQTNCNLKQQKYRQFQSSLTQYLPPEGKHRITIELEDLPLILGGAHHTAEVGLELITPLARDKAKPVAASKAINTPHSFTLSEEPPESMILRVHYWRRGLQQSLLGDFLVRRPRQGQPVRGEWQNENGMGQVKGRVTYQRLNPKFKMIRHHRG